MRRPPHEMDLRECPHGKFDYFQLLQLRNEILREPIQLQTISSGESSEIESRHFGLFKGFHPVACLVVTPRQDGVQLRQMLVIESHRGQGIGRLLLSLVEERLQLTNVRSIYLHARKTAQPFYEKCQYQTTGEEFVEVTLPHIKMTKIL